jgi:methyl-accepting chemotaxis protein
MSQSALAEALDRRTQDFRNTAIRIASAVIALVAAISVSLLAMTGQSWHITVYPLVAGVVAALALVLALQDQAARAVLVLCYGVTATAAAFLLFSEAVALHSVAHTALVVLMLLAGFLLDERAARGYGIANLVVLVAVGVRRATLAGADANTLITSVANVLLFALAWIIATVVARHFHGHVRLLRDRLQDIDTVVEQAKRIATGDLSGEVRGDNDVSHVIDEMMTGLRAIVRQVQEGVHILGSAASELAAMATQQERGVVQQATAMSETRETIESVAESARQIADSTRDVLQNAESTLKTNELVSERIGALIDHTQRIGELLELIKEVSNKSEVLALNAALEGTKAGEAGRGFSLVAAQMQRLAESTMGTLKDVKVLVSDIDKATHSTVLSIEQATKLAADTTRAAREIALITQQQRSSAEQVVQAIQEIATVTNEVASGTKDSMAAADELKKLSDKLSAAVHRFVL